MGSRTRKKVIILSGVSGSGKTYARTHNPELAGLPCVDIADIYTEFAEFDWLEALYAVLKRIRELLVDHNTVLAEGYFLEGSRSLRILLNDLKVAGARAEVRVFWEPLKVCEDRLIKQWEKGEQDAVQTRQRMDLLHSCWRPREE